LLRSDVKKIPYLLLLLACFLRVFHILPSLEYQYEGIVKSLRDIINVTRYLQLVINMKTASHTHTLKYLQHRLDVHLYNNWYLHILLTTACTCDNRCTDLSPKLHEKTGVVRCNMYWQSTNSRLKWLRYCWSIFIIISTSLKDVPQSIGSCNYKNLWFYCIFLKSNKNDIN
jgi:hypothetical protein